MLSHIHINYYISNVFAMGRRLGEEKKSLTFASKPVKTFMFAILRLISSCTARNNLFFYSYIYKWPYIIII